MYGIVPPTGGERFPIRTEGHRFDQLGMALSGPPGGWRRRDSDKTPEKIMAEPAIKIAPQNLSQPAATAGGPTSPLLPRDQRSRSFRPARSDKGFPGGIRQAPITVIERLALDRGELAYLSAIVLIRNDQIATPTRSYLYRIRRQTTDLERKNSDFRSYFVYN